MNNLISNEIGQYVLYAIIFLIVAIRIIKSVIKDLRVEKNKRLLNEFYDENGDEKHPFGTRHYGEEPQLASLGNEYRTDVLCDSVEDSNADFYEFEYIKEEIENCDEEMINDITDVGYELYDAMDTNKKKSDCVNNVRKHRRY